MNMNPSATAVGPARADVHMADWLRNCFRDAKGSGVTIAVVDSGWRSDWKNAEMRPGFAVVQASRGKEIIECAGADDRLGHGTMCTLLVRELAPKATILPIKIFDGALHASSRVAAAAIHAAVREGADVINLSLCTRSRPGSVELYEACRRAVSAGAIVVASADYRMGGFPAVFDVAIGVGGSALSARLAYARSPVSTLDFVANDKTYVTFPTPTGERCPMVGTSMAAPIISGLCGLLRERHLASTLQEAVTWLNANVPVLSDSVAE